MSRSLTLAALLAGLGLVATTAHADLEVGRKLYDKNCTQCHGADGAGQGAATPFVKPKPRDFTAGKFKIRTTPAGSLPTDADLASIIRRGMPFTSMPAWPEFTEAEIASLVEVVKSFSEDFANPDKKPTPLDLPKPPPFSAESAESGRAVYEELGCVRCHGERGRGDGISAPTLEDDWGDHIRPANLAQPWTFRGGATRADIFRAISAGLTGTPMPGFADASEASARWQLVDYIVSLGRGENPTFGELVTVKKVALPIDAEAEGFATLFDGAPTTFVPIVGQIMEPGREFHPSTTEVAVRAVYNDDDIAFELRWHDMRAETTGTNAPDLEVPLFADDPHRGAAPADAGEEPEDEDDPWGGEAVDEEEAADDEGDVWGDAAVDEDEGGDEGGGFWDDGADEEEGVAEGPETEFSDAVAMQFPSAKVTGIQRPYFIFGDADHPVDVWFVDLATTEPSLWVGRGSAAIESGGPGDLGVVAEYEEGEWRVVVQRPRAVRGEAPFTEGEFHPVAFSVWDGFNRERGNKRGLSQWGYVFLEPGGEKSAVGPMVRAAAITLLFEILVVAIVRRRFKSTDLDAMSVSGDSGGTDV